MLSFFFFLSVFELGERVSVCRYLASLKSCSCQTISDQTGLPSCQCGLYRQQAGHATQTGPTLSLARVSLSVNAFALSHWLVPLRSLPSPSRYQWQRMLEAGRRGRFSSSGGQFGKLSPYLFLIKKINDSHGCQLTMEKRKCEQAPAPLPARFKSDAVVLS